MKKFIEIDFADKTIELGEAADHENGVPEWIWSGGGMRVNIAADKDYDEKEVAEFLAPKLESLLDDAATTEDHELRRDIEDHIDHIISGLDARQDIPCTRVHHDCAEWYDNDKKAILKECDFVVDSNWVITDLDEVTCLENLKTDLTNQIKEDVEADNNLDLGSETVLTDIDSFVDDCIEAAKDAIGNTIARLQDLLDD